MAAAQEGKSTIKTKYLAFLALVGLPSHAGAQLFSLGTAQNFAVLGGSAVTNTGPSVIKGGNVGVSYGSAVSGFPPGIVTPPYAIHIGDAVTQQAQNDVTTAYNTLAGMASTRDLTGQDLGGLTLLPGVYHFDSSAQLTGALTLNALGNSDALFVFQIGSTLTTAGNASVLVINGGDECNLFWQVGSSVTLGTTTAFKGNILADQSITLDTGADVNSGRVLAQNGAVTLDSNDIICAECRVAVGSTGTLGIAAVPETGSIVLLVGLSLTGAGFLFRHRKQVKKSA